MAFAEELTFGAKDLVLEGAKLSVGVLYFDFDGDGVELACLADEFVFEGTSEDVEFSGLQVKVRHGGVEEEFASFSYIKGIHSEVDVSNGVGVLVGGDHGIDEPFAFEVAV